MRRHANDSGCNELSTNPGSKAAREETRVRACLCKLWKPFKVREDKRANSGTVIMGHHDVKLGLGIVLTREGSVLSFVLYNLRTAQTLKQLRSRIENNYANYHHIFRVSSDEKLLLCYHESRTDIEVRRLNTLKQRGSLDLIQICKTFWSVSIKSDFPLILILSLILERS